VNPESARQPLTPVPFLKFVFFSDPDGNNWGVQEVRERAGAQLA
jgi:hypothetical protein